MTREEAIVYGNDYYADLISACCKIDEKHKEFVRMSLEALEQEPCEDCISRAELLKAVDTWDKFGCDADTKLVPYKDCYVPYIHYDDVVKAIKGMPSIQPKTGHWISKHIVDDCNGVVTWYECSECGRCVDAPITEEFMLKDYPYCHCGAKMESEE